MLNRLKDWHIRKLDLIADITGLSPYQILWIAFIEGLCFGLFFGWLIWAD